MARVLAVDDDHVIRGLLEVNLEMEGHEVVSAVDGSDALAKIDHLPVVTAKTRVLRIAE